MKLPLCLIALAITTGLGATELPHLRRQGTATPLIVDGQPFLARRGELSNSHGEPEYLRSFWPKLKALHLNTLVTPVYWNVIEPGRFSLQRVKL